MFIVVSKHKEIRLKYTYSYTSTSKPGLYYVCTQIATPIHIIVCISFTVRYTKFISCMCDLMPINCENHLRFLCLPKGFEIKQVDVLLYKNQALCVS